MFITNSEVVLCFCIPLLGGFEKPFNGRSLILCDSLTIFITTCIITCEVELRVSMSLLGGHVIPSNGLCLVLRHSLTGCITTSEIELSVGMTLRCSGKCYMVWSVLRS